MHCGWEGKRRSDIALAMRHRLSGISTYGGSMAWEREISTSPEILWHLYICIIIIIIRV